MKTTLNKIRDHGISSDGWVKLLKQLGKKRADNKPLSIIKVLDSNGLDDALWCLRAVDGHDREIRLYAVWCARRVRHRMKDPRSLAALDEAEKFANGLASRDGLYAAWAAARAAAWAAAGGSAWAAAGGSAGGSAWAAARDAAWAAAGDAGLDAEWDAQETELRRVCECIEAGIDPYPPGAMP